MYEVLKNNYKKLLYVICGIGFTFGVIFSICKNPWIFHSIRFLPALFIFSIGVPLTLFVNSFEYILMGKLNKKDIYFINAVEICIFASAANMLPIPGGAITRIAGLKKAGVTYLDATTTNLLFGLIWLALAFLTSGAGLIFFAQNFYGGIFLLTGTVLLTLNILKMHCQGASLAIVIFSILQRIAMITIDTIRLWGCLIALGIDAKILQATIFALSGVLGSAVSIVPAGLGIREGVSAGLAPLVGLGASMGFLAAALNRLLGLGFLSPSAFLLFIYQRRKDIQIKGSTSHNK